MLQGSRVAILGLHLVPTFSNPFVLSELQKLFLAPVWFFPPLWLSQLMTSEEWPDFQTTNLLDFTLNRLFFFQYILICIMYKFHY